MKSISRLIAAGALATCVAVPAGISLAQSAPATHVEEAFSGSRLVFNGGTGLSNFTLRVAGPDGYQGEVYSARVLPTLRLEDHGRVPDGLYTYELTAATQERAVVASPRPSGSDGRPASAGVGFVGVSQNGSFRVADGRIVEIDQAAVER